MAGKNNTSLKSLIKENPHWIITWGTMVMAFVIIGFLVVTTQFTLKDTVVKELFVDISTNRNEMKKDSLIAFFPINAEEEFVVGQKGKIRMVGDDIGNYVQDIELAKIGKDEGMLLFPYPKKTEGSRTMDLDCSIKAYVEIEQGEISVFNKLMKTLFHSIKI